jgi:hypothetical protein
MAAQITTTTPWYVGQTYPTVAIPLNTDSGSDDITNMTASNFAIIIRNLDQGGADQLGAGTIVVYSASPAVLYYTFDPGDVQTAGNCTVQVKATFPNGGVAYYDPIPFYIKAV